MAISSQISVYLYERLYVKLSDDSFHDNWSIVGFVVIFLFCCLMITLFMTVLFTSCCGRCFDGPPVKMGKVAALPATPSGPKFTSEVGSHVTVYSAPSTVMDSLSVKEAGSKKTVAPPPPGKNLDRPKKSKHKNKAPNKGKSQSHTKRRHKETH